MLLARSIAAIASLVPLTTARAASEPWRAFSAESPWNQRIPADAAVDPHSAELIAELGSRGPLFVNISDWSIAAYFVDADRTPKHDVGDLRPGIFGAGFEFPRSIPIPDNAVASPPVSDDSDNHLAIIDRVKNLEWGMWAARRDDAGRWFTGLGAVTDLSGSGVAPPWFESARELDSHRARASGFPLIAGLILLDEMKRGQIDHALVFAYDRCRSEFFIPPASTAQATKSAIRNSGGIPMGGRIQLDPNWDVENSGLSAAGKTIARALQQYGAFCGDFADANVLYAENSPEAVQAWQGVLDSDELAAVFTPEMISRHFRVIAMGNLLPGQNLKVRPPYVLSFRAGDASDPALIDHLARTITLAVPASPVAVTWSAYPHSCGAEIDGRPLNPGDTTTLTKGSILTLTSPDGSTATWQILPPPR